MTEGGAFYDVDLCDTVRGFDVATFFFDSSNRVASRVAIYWLGILHTSNK